jgi:hypothetical protein
MNEQAIHYLTHFLCGFSIAFTLQFGLPDKPYGWQIAPMGVAAVAGVGKELIDQRNGGEFNVAEAGMTAFGGVTAFFTYTAIDKYVRPLYKEEE